MAPAMPISAPDRRRACAPGPAFRAEHRGDHLVRRPVAHPAQHEQQREREDEQRQALAERGDEHERGADGHGGGRARGHPRPAPAVGRHAAGGPHQRAEQPAEEGQVGGVQRGREAVGELHLQDLPEREAEADEGPERADVEERQHPGVRVVRDVAQRAPVVAGRGQVVHRPPGRPGGHEHERDVGRDEHAGVRGADGREHQQAGELHDGDAEVATPGVDAEGPALEALGVEGVDVGHRGGEVAAAHARDGRDDQERPERDARLEHDERQQQRHEQQQRADDGPVAPAEAGDRQRVRQPQSGADQRGHARQQERVGRREAVLRPQEQHEHRPHRPDREADVLGQDRHDQVAAGDLRAAARPDPGPPGASRRSIGPATAEGQWWSRGWPSCARSLTRRSASYGRCGGR